MTIDELIALMGTVQPTPLTPFQEWILRQSWAGETYTAMAADRHYRVEYIRRVGADLWTMLSDYFGEAITKPHLRELLQSRGLTKVERRLVETVPVVAPAIACPSSPLALESSYYIQRPPVEDLAFASIIKPGSLVRIKAPMKMGKSSLIFRMLAHAQAHNSQTVSLNLQQVDRDRLGSLDRFLRWLCANVSRQLHLPLRLDDYWDDELGGKMSCTYYLEECVLEALNQPLVIALDEVNCVFEYPELAREFLPLLRFWHTQASQSSLWKKLSLVMAYSTEVYVPLNLNQSPFNVGVPLELPPLTEEQGRSLVLKYGLDLKNNAKLKQFIHLVGGFPYLLQIGLYHLQRGDITIDQLLQNASTEAGIYRQHLRQQMAWLSADAELLSAYQDVIAAATGLKLEAITAYKLNSLGLVQLKGNLAQPSCDLYRLYFAEQFSLQNGDVLR